MATRADFYIMNTDGSLELLGCTLNDYDGPFEDATNEDQFRKEVSIMLQRNESVAGKWYWPWKNSHISDQVFIFKKTPKLLNKKKGVVMTKVHINPDTTEDQLAIVRFEDRYNEKYYNEDGYYDTSKVEIINLPSF